MMYRVRQFIWGLTAKLTSSEVEFINRYLIGAELRLFFMLPMNEQCHCVKVAVDVKKELEIALLEDEILIKAALLHDIGKLNSGINIWSKSIIVLGDKIAPKFMKRLTSLRAVNAYYNHADMAEKYLEFQDEELKYYILNHHRYDIKNDQKLLILQSADSRN